jgi:hypothetical protein
VLVPLAADLPAPNPLIIFHSDGDPHVYNIAQHFTSDTSQCMPIDPVVVPISGGATTDYETVGPLYPTVSSVNPLVLNVPTLISSPV